LRRRLQKYEFGRSNGERAAIRDAERLDSFRFGPINHTCELVNNPLTIKVVWGTNWSCRAFILRKIEARLLVADPKNTETLRKYVESEPHYPLHGPMASSFGTVGPTSIRSTILQQLQQIALEQEKPLAAPLTDDVPLLDSGLDSLCFAILIGRLEDAIGVDPFTTSDDAAVPYTVGEFIRLYENAGLSIDRYVTG
jgi:acyl carrier protein